MNKHASRSAVAAAVAALATTVAMSVASAEVVDWKPMMTIAERQRDEQGNLLPLQSYDETIRRGMSFILDDHLKWFKGPADTLIDENGKTQMPWVYYSNLQHNGAPFPNSIDRFVSYPAFHHALMIRTLVGYWRYAKDDRALKEAIKLADWNIAHSTPADWAYGNLPYSTFQEKKPGGFRDKTGLMPDKAAIMALAYLQLHEASGEARFLAAAEAIGHTLSQRQRPNGTWPFRVDPKTEAVIEEYTSSVIYAVMLFESLDKINGNNKYKAHRDLTWNWLLNGPIKTKEFRGFYEDIPDTKSNRTNYDCLDTIRYLLANRTDSNGYLEIAKELNVWIEKIFLDKIKGFEPAQGIREQLACNVVMGIHSLNWASMLRELAEATGDEKMRQRAIQTANYITYYLQRDNRIVVGFQYHQWWYSCHTGVILYLLDFVDEAETFAKESVSQKPNIVLILADDMGYSDLGCYGGEIETPHLNRLADHGLRFTQFYNTSRCWPTRAALLTGLYNDQTGIHDLSHQLNRRCVTIAEVLRSAGYGTYMVGKWHLMKDWNDPTTDRWPLQRGFDRFYGTPVAGNFFNPFNPVRDRTPIKIEDKDYYVTDALTDNAIDYIREHTARRKDDPFFLYVAHFAPHWPLHARPDDIEVHRGRYDKGWAAVRAARHKRMIELGILDARWKLSRPETESPTWADATHKPWEARRMEVHAAMVHRMDHGIGRIVETLEIAGQLDNTLIFFLSDNGASSENIGRVPDFERKKTLDGKPMHGGNDPAIMPGPADTYQSFGRRWANVSVTPFRKYKAFTHEGGIATPLIVYWPQGISARGELRQQPGHVIDIMATCVEASGAAYPDEYLGQRIHPAAGVSLVPAFANKALDRDAIYFQHLGNRAVRAGKWKLVALKGKPWELYDLEVDRTETANLISPYPEKSKELAERWRAWATQVGAPK